MSTPLYVIENIKTCHRCVAATARAGGKVVCPADGGEIHVHAENGDCPKGLHSASDGSLPPAALRDLGIPLPGDMIEAITKRTGIERFAKAWSRLTGKPCNCPERKEKINRAAKRLARRFGYDWSQS